MNVSRVVKACVHDYVDRNRRENAGDTDKLIPAPPEPIGFTTDDVVAYYDLDTLGLYNTTSVGEQAVRNAMNDAEANGDVRVIGKNGRYKVYAAVTGAE